MIKLLECYDPKEVVGLLARQPQEVADVDAAVAAILADVKARGDLAVLEYTAKFDGAELTALEVDKEEIEAAVRRTDPEFLEILKESAENIRAFHQQQKSIGFVMTDRPGIVLGQRYTPLDRVGVYVPGGTASYPSTVLMDIIPAKIAGVGEIIMASPPDKSGNIPGDILAAAYVAGADRVFKMGGAQAVGALSYGTASVPRVDKIVGPGNIYVATAKRMVYGLVAIDMIAGPSDILVVADDNANPNHVAADLLSQAEHDKLASAVLVTTSKALAKAVLSALESQLAALPRKKIAGASLESRGAVILTDTLENAVAISNQIAPEHLELSVADPFALLPLVCHAGSIFLGHNTPEALGDYFAGPNHTLPTEGTARFSSPLSVDDFVKKSSFLYYDRGALEKAGQKVAAFAAREGLDAHARSVTIRLNEKGENK